MQDADFVAQRAEIKLTRRFVRIEDHTHDSLSIAYTTILRHLNKPGRSNMMECYARIIRECELGSDLRFLMASGLETIAAREQASLIT